MVTTLRKGYAALRGLRYKTTLSALLVFGLLLALYIRTLMPGTVGGDAGELQYAGPILALVHPTGQPLYVLLGKLWSLIVPVGDVAWRMNLLAAVSTAGGAALLTWLVGRVFDHVVIGIVAGLALGLGGTLWGQAVLADKYGFNVLLAAVIVGLTLWWARDHAKPHGDRVLLWLAAAFGLGLLHHRSLALFAVGIGIMVLWHLRADLWRRWRRTALAAALVLLPALLVYPTVLPLLRANDNSPLMWQPDDPADWVDFLMERHVISGEALVFDDTDSINRQLEIYAETVLADYGVVVVIVAAVGFLALLLRMPSGGVFLLVSFALQAFLSANFRGNERQFTYYLPSFVTLIYAFAYGLLTLWDAVKRWAATWQGDGRKVALTAAASVLVFALPAALAWNAYPDRREDAVYGEPLDLWRQTLKTGDMGDRLTADLESLPQGALLAADWEQVTILWYEQQVEGRRPDLEIVYPIERYTEAEPGQPVCLARHLPTGAAWHPTNIGAFVCLDAAPRISVPEGLTPPVPNGNMLTETIGLLRTDAGDPQLRLLGHSLPDDPRIRAGQHVAVTLTWQALADLDADYAVSLQVRDESWNLVWKRDIQHPVMGLAPTSRWAAGQVVSDYHEIPIPRDMPPGRYLWTVEVYRSDDFAQLRDSGGGVNMLVGTFEVIPG